MSDKVDGTELKSNKYKEFDRDFEARREQSLPAEDVIRSQSLTADQEDRGKNFNTEKIKRDMIRALDREYLSEVSTKAKISPHINLPRSELLVTWRDFRGMSSTDDAIEISLTGVKFYCDSNEPVAISQVNFPLTGRVMDVTSSEHISHNGEVAVFRIKEFANNADDWVAWIEHFTQHSINNAEDIGA